MDKQFIYAQRSIRPTSTWVLFILFGWSYGSMNKMGLQLMYWLTLGGFGVWALIRLLTLNDAIREYNLTIGRECGFTEDELRQLGLLLLGDSGEYVKYTQSTGYRQYERYMWGVALTIFLAGIYLWLRAYQIV